MRVICVIVAAMLTVGIDTPSVVQLGGSTLGTSTCSLVPRLSRECTVEKIWGIVCRRTHRESLGTRLQNKDSWNPKLQDMNKPVLFTFKQNCLILILAQ